MAVAPHTGAWIETLLRVESDIFRYVAPHTGAWIETLVSILHGIYKLVAPHTGAWIETKKCLKYCYEELSHLIRVRGLKLQIKPK